MVQRVYHALKEMPLKLYSKFDAETEGVSGAASSDKSQLHMQG